ncbi:hypothetical protein H4R19_001148 [Coemansia spiralis]|nr:hypothetical protein H4R19_001148 [Coemansia spiralis]
MSREPLSYRQRLNAHMVGQSSATLGYPHEAETHMPHAYHHPAYCASRQGVPVAPQPQYAAMGEGQQQAGRQMYYPPGREEYPHASSAFSQYPSKSDTAPVSSKASQASRRMQNSFAVMAKDCLKSVQLQDAVPLVTTLSAAIYHHFNNRRSEDFVPYQHPHWIGWVYRGMMVYSAYTFAKARGLIGSSRKKPQNQPTGPGGAHGTRGIADVAQRPAPTPASRGSRTPVPAAAVADMHQLFGSAAVEPGNAIDEYDARWAVPKEAARQHYHAVYHAQLDLRSAGPQVLGGAAAIRALRKETAQQRMQHDPRAATCCGARLTVMDCALAEVDGLLRRKAAATKLTPADTLENVGRIALATIIKIKMDHRAA